MTETVTDAQPLPLEGLTGRDSFNTLDAAKRMTWLEDRIEEIEEANGDADEYQAELSELEDLQAEVGDGFSEGDGVDLISDYHFEDHAREQYEEMYGHRIDSDAWPFDCIDWERAADQLKDSYSTVDVNGYTFHYQN